MTKIDFKKTLKQLYQPSAKDFTLVEVPPMNYLMIDGRGSPDTEPSYVEAIEALYAVAYKLKFMSKNQMGQDYVMPPLEGLWWAEDITVYIRGEKDRWEWTMMLMQPEWITAEMFAAARQEVAAAKNPPALPKMRLESYAEGLSFQIMHIGSYADEAPTLARLHNDYLPQNGYVEAGKHHEIYLSDPRVVIPEKLKTILRQPVRRVSG